MRAVRFLPLAQIWPLPAHALDAWDPLFNFNALTYQDGNGFEAGDDRRQILTLEHYSLWGWGDFYAFVDRIREDPSGRLAHYSEWSPRVSLSLLGLDTRGRWLKELLLAGTYENGSEGYEAWLIGPGVTWNLPPFAHLETNLYRRDTRNLSGATWQITAAWALPFQTGPLHWLFDGYVDVRGPEGPAAADLNFNPQLKLDLGRFLGAPDHLYAGVEYYHWHNTYGIDGLDERTVSPLIQARFSF